LIVDRVDEDGHVSIERVDLGGRTLRVLSRSPTDYYSACTRDGLTWFLADQGARPNLARCDDNGCREISAKSVVGLSVSPDGDRLAFVSITSLGLMVEWMSSNGGEIHEITQVDSLCRIGWATARTIWVSKKRDGALVWTEFDVDCGRATGRTTAGTHDCSDGLSDPASPLDSDLRVVASSTSQLRFIGGEHLSVRQ
jgi:hypothetical protein